MTKRQDILVNLNALVLVVLFFVGIFFITEYCGRNRTHLSENELAKCSAKFKYGTTYLNANFYNGTDEKIKSIVVRLKVINPKGSVKFEKLFNMDTLFDAPPLKVTEFFALVGDELEEGETFNATIVSAEKAR